MFVTALLGVLTAIAVPQTLATVNRSRSAAAARYLAAQMALARATAVRRSANVALRFEARAGGWEYGVFIDGNRNGVRSRDIASGIDTALEGYVSLSQRFPGVRLALGAGEGADAVRAGASDMVSFTAYGTATSSTVYVRGADGSQYAVRVLGATARTRVLRYVPARREWVEGL